MVQIQIKKYLIPLTAAAVITGCSSPDPKIDEYGLKTLRAVGAYPDSRYISFLYDLDGDNRIDVIEYRRWREDGKISAPIQAHYDKDNNMDITYDEVARWEDPLPDAPPCPPLPSSDCPRRR